MNEGIQGSRSFLIVGLSAFDETDYQKYFEETPIFVVEDYRSNGWFENICNRIRFVVRAKSALSGFVNENYDLDLIILLARKPNEFDPVCSVLSWIEGSDFKSPQIPDLVNKFGVVRMKNGLEIRVGVVCLGTMGLSVSAAVATRLVYEFRPRYFAMLGMCCGFKRGDKTKLGDIVVARQTANWDEGKYKSNKIDGVRDQYFHNRSIERFPQKDFGRKIADVLEASEQRLKDVVREHYSKQDLQKLKGEIGEFSIDAEVHFGVLVSGSSVVDNLKFIDKIVDRFPKAIALEMEAHSIYSAMDYVAGAVPDTIVIKGVADHGDGHKKNSLQPLASAASALAYMELLNEILS